MQHYKLNTRFLIILLVIFAGVLGGGYGLWAFQIRKSAPGLREEALKAYEEQRYRQANDAWRRYLGLRPGDIDGQIRYAKTQLEFANSREANPNSDEILGALMEAERVLRSNPIPRDPDDWSDEMRQAVPQLDELREQAAETRIHFNLWKDAIDHLNYLIDVRKSKNPRHEVLRLRSLVGRQLYEEAIAKGYELVGYDERADRFDESKAIAPHETEGYVLLAASLRRAQKASQLADRVMHQLVNVNPNSHEAFLQRSLYWQQNEQMDLARQDWERAYSLNKDDLKILLSGSRLAFQQEDAALALELATSALEKHPGDYQAYSQLARAQAVNGQLEKAVETINAGIQIIKSGREILDLLIVKCDLQLRGNKIQDARSTIKDLDEILRGHDIPRYFEGRAHLAEHNWLDAVKIFEQARAGLSKPEIMYWYPTLLPELDQFRGLAYTQLGERDRARDAYEKSLERNPDQPRVREIVEGLKKFTGPAAQASTGSGLADQVEAMLKRPAAEQRWQQIEDFIRNEIADKELDEATAKMYWAEYRYRRKQTAQAYALVQEALKLNPSLNVVLMAIRYTALLPEGGPEAAHPLIGHAVERFGDNSSLRLERGRVWLIEGADDLVAKLWSLEKGSDVWDNHQRTYFLKMLAEYFQQIGAHEDADRALTLAFETSPQDLEALMGMFTNARQRQDNAAMQQVQQKIEQAVGSKNDSRWQYTEAARLITLYAAGMRDDKLLQQAIQLTEAIEKQRSQWHELYRLRGDIFSLRGQYREAIAAYSQALELGPPVPLAVRQHAQLLAMQQRYIEARRVANLLPEPLRMSVMGTLYAEILLNAADSNNRSEMAQALETAKQVVEMDANNAGKHLWYADQLIRRGIIKEAEAPVRRALEINPHDMQTWVLLVRYLVGDKRPEEAEQALREARLVLPEHEIPLLVAQGYALLGKWWQAEQEFLIAHQAEPENLRRIRLLADFYLGMFYQRDDRYAKAVPYLNMLLAQPGDSAADLESVQWARRKAAEIFARTGDYQNTLKAERLLKSNEVGGVLPAEDKLLLAKILASRPEPTSRRTAIGLLEDVQGQGGLDRDSALLLAQLYWKLDRQNDARQQIINVVAWHGDEPRVWQTFVAMQLARGNYGEAARYFQDKLEPTLPNPLTLARLDDEAVRTLTLGVQIWNKQGQKDKALQRLYSTIPRDLDIRDEDVPKLLHIGAMLVLLGEKDRAAPVYQLFAQKRPQQGLVYVKFLGAYQNLEEAFGFLETMEKSTPPGGMFPILQTGLSIVNARRDEIGDAKDALIEQWMQKALRENPDSTDLLGLKADLLEMQQRYQEAQDVYERILATPGFSGLMRSRVLNNLAYLLALQNMDMDRALRLVEEAQAIRGPSDDILDTRGVVHLARGNFNAAIEDLEMAVTEDPTAEKWFHLARAYWSAGRRQDALVAWERAKDLDIGPEKLNRMEHEAFQQFTQLAEQELRRSGRGGPGA